MLLAPAFALFRALRALRRFPLFKFAFAFASSTLSAFHPLLSAVQIFVSAVTVFRFFTDPHKKTVPVSRDGYSGVKHAYCLLRIRAIIRPFIMEPISGCHPLTDPVQYSNLFNDAADLLLRFFEDNRTIHQIVQTPRPDIQFMMFHQLQELPLAVGTR